MIYLSHETKHYGPFRALCDTASHINLIRSDLIKECELKTFSCNLNVWGFNDETPTILNQRIVMQLLSRHEVDSNTQIDLICVPKITGQLPIKHFKKPHMAKHVERNLADPTFNTPNQIDVLLAANTWSKIVYGEKEEITNSLSAHSSKLGYLIIGEQQITPFSVLSCISNDDAPSKEHNSYTIEEEEKLDRLMRNFWEVEHKPIRNQTQEHKLCEEIFINEHHRDKTGRFVVKMPLKPNIVDLGNSKGMAFHRFRQLENRLHQNPELRRKYVKFMRDYETSGHMKIAMNAPSIIINYLPHHFVEPKPSKFRVVFDGSAKTNSGISFNNTQMVGDRLQSNIADVLFRFRCFKVGMAADVVQMYRQIKINDEQIDLQRIFWRYTDDEPIKEYQLTCVTQGLASASHCAVRSMLQCGMDSQSKFPLANIVIKDNSYMDDYIFGASDTQSAVDLYSQLTECLATGGFELSKWTSNDEIFLNTIGCEKKLECALGSNDSSILGLNWLLSSDHLTIKTNLSSLPKRLTKSCILSAISRLYDPCGFISPIIVIGKLIMQDIWLENIEWTEVPSTNIIDKFTNMHQRLTAISNIRIPRWFGCSPTSESQLFGFADASGRAYGCVLYLRTQNSDGSVVVNLIGSKSRIAPIKTMTIPRLELCACELLAEFAAHIVAESRINIQKTILYTDSTVVLHWIKKPAIELQVLVANRVAAIQNYTSKMSWRHVSSKENPADIISRGMYADELSNSKLWFEGPFWLKKGEENWPKWQPELSIKEKSQLNTEIKKNAVTHTVNLITQHNEFSMKGNVLQINNQSVAERCSSLPRLLRITSYFFRAVKAFKGDSFSTDVIQTEEYAEALRYWIKIDQLNAYTTDIKSLQNKDVNLMQSSKIKYLAPWLDDDKLLRIGGRVQNAELKFDEKHPILLSEKGRIAVLLVHQTHQQTKHGGIQDVMRVIRNTYWIPRLRQLVKKCISHCVTCVRAKAKLMQQFMANLPVERVRTDRCFRNVGVDFAGPITIRAKHDIRNPRLAKGYICVFVCLASRAVHLEIVEDLTTNAFLDAFSRFVARRGAVTTCFSDNGKNFHGAAKHLRAVFELCQNSIVQEKIQSLGTKWKFITPISPHQGGLWEAAVREMKKHLQKITKTQIFSLTNLMTMITQIEAIMNSRPIAPMSDDAMDMVPITPAHFLIGEALVQPYHTPVQHLPDNRLKMRERIQKNVQTFWTRFSEDYIRHLQQRFKWNSKEINLNIGDLVIIKAEHMPPTLWQMGRVAAVHPGKDGLIRNVTLRTETGNLQRSIQNVCKLPTEEEAE